MIWLVQYLDERGERCVAVRTGEAGPRKLDGVTRVYDLAQQAIARAAPLHELVEARVGDVAVDYEAVCAERRFLPPLDHPDPAHCSVTGTGLTHLRSSAARDEMHASRQQKEAETTDTSRMYQLGVDGGKPLAGKVGVQPEWFFKGCGDCVVAPEHALPSPAFALDAGEEPEVVGLYVVAPNGRPCRVGYALGNEFSDHVTERQNYLYLAHSKLRHCSFGPELLVGALPTELVGDSRILRDGQTIWESPFYTGEAHMSHTLANLEHHHFKYDIFRRPGDVHCHFMGTSTLSFGAGVRTRPGDTFEIECKPLGRPLRNQIELVPDRGLVTVAAL